MNDLTPTRSARLDVMLRPYQLSRWTTMARFMVLVWHRRAGKTFFVIAWMLACALTDRRKAARYYYIAPTLKAAKAISWDYLVAFCEHMPGTEIRKGELSVTLWNGAKIQLLGVENYETLRGRYAMGLVLDEAALVPTAAWENVLQPLLADHLGWAIVIGTPAGRMNLLYRLYEKAQADTMGDWMASLLTVDDTICLDPREVERFRRDLSPEAFDQEFMCSWDAAITGAYYANAMAQAHDEGRVTKIPYDPAIPITCSMDLGWADTMTCAFWQCHGKERRLLRAQGYEWTDIPGMIGDWRKTLPWDVDLVILPHDAKVHELQTGMTREDTFNSAGYRTIIAPRLSMQEGIEQTKQYLRQCWFHEDETATMREALNTYRSEKDSVRDVYGTKPIHDWSSHWADAVKTMATGDPGPQMLGLWNQDRDLSGLR